MYIAIFFFLYMLMFLYLISDCIISVVCSEVQENDPAKYNATLFCFDMVVSSICKMVKAFIYPKYSFINTQQKLFVSTDCTLYIISVYYHTLYNVYTGYHNVL